MVCYAPLTIRRVATISALFRAVRICLERPDVAEFLSVFAAVATKDNPEGSAVLAHWRFEFVSSTAVVPVNHNTVSHDFYPAVVPVSTSKPDTVQFVLGRDDDGVVLNDG